MAQLNFESNYFALEANQSVPITDATMTFVPFNVCDSVSFNFINFLASVPSLASTRSYTFSVGLYSLSAGSLTLINSANVVKTFSGTAAVRFEYISVTATSATQNISPGSWFFGLLIRTGNTNDIGLVGQNSIPIGGNFPGGFIGGAMGVTTAALPSLVDTTTLDISDANALNVPFILVGS